MDSKSRVSIIIPNYNGEVFLRENLPEVIKAKNYSANSILEIIVVDDGSKDDSVTLLAKDFPEVRVIKHTKNRGFSAAVNTGARSAKGNLIALLNTDVVPSSNFLAPALNHFDDPKVFAVSFHEKGYGPAKGIFRGGFIVHEPLKETEKPRNTFWVSGGSGIFRRDLWIKLGGMDERLLSPYYWEDIDLSYKALKRGYKLLWEPESYVLHEHEGTISRLPQKGVKRIQERNQLLFIWKNLTSPALFRKHVTGLIKRIGKSPGYLRIVFMALPRLRLALKSRRKERKESKVSDEAIFANF